MTFSEGEKKDNQNLVRKIVSRSQGVFLWGFLVIRSLNEGMTNGVNIAMLKTRLHSLPVDLEKFFQHIIRQVDELQQQDMARTFQQALQAAEPLTLREHSFLEEPNDYATSLELCEMDVFEVDIRNQRMRRRIDARCKGLVEVCSDLTKIDRWARSVEFLHRTVPDFLLMKNMQHMLNQKLEPRINISQSLCRSHSALIKTMPHDDHANSQPVRRSVNIILYRANQAEVETGISDETLLNDLEGVLDELSLRLGCSILNQNGAALTGCSRTKTSGSSHLAFVKPRLCVR